MSKNTLFVNYIKIYENKIKKNKNLLRNVSNVKYGKSVTLVIFLNVISKEE